MISGRKVLANDSSSYFGTPLFVSGDGGNPFRSSLFITLRFAAIRQRFYLCRSFLLLDSDRLCPSGDWFVIHFSSEIWFLLFGKSNWKWNSLMCQVGWHTRLWIIFIQVSFYCYYIKFEHICQVFGVESTLVSSFPHTELFFGAVRRFLCMAPQYLTLDLSHTEQIKTENFYL